MQGLSAVTSLSSCLPTNSARSSESGDELIWFAYLMRHSSHVPSCPTTAGDAHLDAFCLCEWWPCPMYTSSGDSCWFLLLLIWRLLGIIPRDSFLVTWLMSNPTAKAMGIIAHSLNALGSISSQSLLSPVHSTGGLLGMTNLAFPSLHAHAETE